VFTGIIEAIGRVTSAEAEGGLARLEIEAPGLAAGARAGDSVAVNGACLSVAALRGGHLCFEAVPETLARTALGDLRAGSRVNLERALRADGRLDGHIVQGHVDGTGRVLELARSGADVRLRVGCGPEVLEFLVEKGSVAVDGVALTIAGLEPEGFAVALIPHTLANTTLGERAPGDRVNLEADVIGKYVRRTLGRLCP
jgi:riboflavin synthase